MSKSTQYLIAIGVLLGLNLYLFLIPDQASSKVNMSYFEDQDWDKVSQFLFYVNDDTVALSRSTEGWVLNESFPADQGFVNTLISVLQRVEVGRVVENWKGEILGFVEIVFEPGDKKLFQISSNPTGTKSYFVTNDVAKEVAVPGYKDNVVELFTLHPDQWRDRTVIDGSWRTIQRVHVRKEDAEDFEIVFLDQFFLVNEQSPKDSAAVVNYLNQFQHFQANEMISPGRFSLLDSLSHTRPIAWVTIDDIKYKEPIELKIFPSMAQQTYHLVMNGEGEMMVIDARRIRTMLTNPVRDNP